MNKIKVAFLDYSPIFAGAERMLFNLISHIDRSKYEPYLIFPFPKDHLHGYDALDCKKIYLADGLKWWMGSDRWKKPIRGTDFLKRAEFGRRIASIINKYKIDILDVNIIRPDILMWVWASHKFTNAKIVGHFRSQRKEWIPPAAAQRIFDMICCVSEFSRMRFRLKGDHTKSCVLYDSIDVDFMKTSLSKNEAKAKLGYSDDVLLITSVGQLSLHKGHDNAIRVFPKVLKRFPNARLLIAGGESDTTPEFFRNLAQEYGVAGNVDIPDSQFPNVQDVYRASDLILSLTKVGEGFGLVPYESALIGTPFIAPEFGAITEFAIDGESAHLVDTNDLDKVVGKIMSALEDYSRSLDMVKRLQSVIYSKLTPLVMTNNYDKLYKKLLSNGLNQ